MDLLKTPINYFKLTFFNTDRARTVSLVISASCSVSGSFRLSNQLQLHSCANRSKFLLHLSICESADWWRNELLRFSYISDESGTTHDGKRGKLGAPLSLAEDDGMVGCNIGGAVRRKCPISANALSLSLSLSLSTVLSAVANELSVCCTDQWRFLKRNKLS